MKSLVAPRLKRRVSFWRFFFGLLALFFVADLIEDRKIWLHTPQWPSAVLTILAYSTVTALFFSVIYYFLRGSEIVRIHELRFHTGFEDSVLMFINLQVPV